MLNLTVTKKNCKNIQKNVISCFYGTPHIISFNLSNICINEFFQDYKAARAVYPDFLKALGTLKIYVSLEFRRKNMLDLYRQDFVDKKYETN